MLKIINMATKTEKRQYRKVGVAGGFINQMMGNNSTLPKVGEGATELMYSDRNPYEVLWVSEDGDMCKIRAYDYKAKHNGMTESQSWEYISKPEYPTETLKWHPKKGWCRYNEVVRIQKSLGDRLWNEFGNEWKNNLPNGMKYTDLIIGGEDNYSRNKFKLVKGYTKLYKEYHPISIIFGFAEKYYDYSF
ncbi:MAG: hypothetical protein Unbinned3907contig1000_19 [Prokaryotic dsDNA virus sp.]|nr:MAG: hypothetical protein Unbinned3907contig1000_19 [Prokaryotic dsDNA virus sp.]